MSSLMGTLLVMLPIAMSVCYQGNVFNKLLVCDILLVDITHVGDCHKGKRDENTNGIIPC
jgi:hypothetical protein